MCNLGSDVNNTPKQILQGRKIREEIDIFNTIEYDVISYQVKTTIVKCTKVRIKLLNFNRSQKYMLV